MGIIAYAAPFLTITAVKANDIENTSGDKHIAGGSHVGLVVNKQIDQSSE